MTGADPIGKSYLILPESTPSKIGIAQVGGALVAVSGCCMETISYRGFWSCNGCQEYLPTAPDAWGESSQHNLAHIAAPSVSEDHSQKAIKFWVSKWTGLTVEKLDVGLEA